jgi:hypothetical protein
MAAIDVGATCRQNGTPALSPALAVPCVGVLALAVADALPYAIAQLITIITLDRRTFCQHRTQCIDHLTHALCCLTAPNGGGDGLHVPLPASVLYQCMNALVAQDGHVVLELRQ